MHTDFLFGFGSSSKERFLFSSRVSSCPSPVFRLVLPFILQFSSGFISSLSVSCSQSPIDIVRPRRYRARVRVAAIRQSTRRATGRLSPGCALTYRTATGCVVGQRCDDARAVSVHARDLTRSTGRVRVNSKNLFILILVLRCLRKIIVPIICWVASETLNRQCSTSESLSNLEASFGLISRFESIAHRYNYFFLSRVCTCVRLCMSCVCLVFVCVLCSCMCVCML